MDELLRLDRELKNSSSASRRRSRPQYTAFSQERSLDFTLGTSSDVDTPPVSSVTSSISPRSPRRSRMSKKSIGDTFASDKERDEERLEHLRAHRMSHAVDNKKEEVAANARRVAAQARQLIEQQEAAEAALSDRVNMRRSFARYFDWYKYELRLSVGSTAVIAFMAKRGIRAFQGGCDIAGRQRLMRIKAVTALLAVKKRRGLNSWMEATMNAHAMRVLLRRATLSFRHFDFRRALNTWLEYAVENGERIRRLQMAASELSGGRRRAAWATWLDFVDERRLLRRSASGLRKPSLLRALLTWESMAVDRSERLHRLSAALTSLRSVGLRRSVNTWRAMSLLQRQATRRLRAAASEWAGGKMRACYSTWVWRSDERRMLLKATQSFRAPGLSKALNAWGAAVVQARAERQILSGALSSLRHRGSRRALNQWRALAGVYSGLKRAMLGMMHRLGRRGFNGWLEYAAAAHEQRRLLQLGGGAFSQSGVRAAMNSWAERAEELLERQRRMKVAIGELSGGKVRAAWFAWRENALARFALRGKARRLKRPELGRAFNQWATLSAITSAKLRLGRRALSSLRAVGLRRGLNSWLTYHVALVEAKRRLHTAAREWGGGKVRGAWLTWVYRVEEQMMLLRAMQSFRKPGLSKALRAWLSMMIASRLASQRLGGAVASLRHRGVRLALNSWRSTASVVRGYKRCLLGLRHRGSRRGFNAWLEYALASHETLRLIRRGGKAFSQTNVRAAMNSWAERAEELLERQRRMKVAIGELSGGKVRAAWFAWLELLAERQLLRRAGMGFRRPAVTKAMRRWAEAAAIASAKLRLGRRALSSLRSVGLRRSFNSWYTLHDQLVEAKRRMRAAAREWGGGKVRAAWLTWVYRVEEQMMLRRAMQSFRKPGLSKALRAWSHTTREAQLAQLILGGAVASLRYRGARAALNSWRAVVATAMRLRGTLASLGSVGLRKGYNTWVEKWAHSTHMAILGLRAIAAIQSAELRRGLNTWVDAVGEHKSATRKARLLYQTAARTLLARTVGGAFQLWRSMSQRRTKMLGAKSMQRCFAVLTARDAMRGAFSAWDRDARLSKRQEMVMLFRDVERDHAASTKRVNQLEKEVADLRKNLVERADELAWKSSFEAENTKLRKQLEESHKASRGLESKNADLEEQYRRLWRATHDPNYVQLAAADEPLVWKVPASRTVVDRLAHVPDNGVGNLPRPKSPPPPRTASPRRTAENGHADRGGPSGASGVSGGGGGGGGGGFGSKDARKFFEETERRREEAQSERRRSAATSSTVDTPRDGSTFASRQMRASPSMYARTPGKGDGRDSFSSFGVRAARYFYGENSAEARAEAALAELEGTPNPSSGGSALRSAGGAQMAIGGLAAAARRMTASGGSARDTFTGM